MPLQSDSKGCYRTSFHTLQSPMQTLLKPFQFVEKSLEMSQVCYNGWSSSYWTKRALIYSIIHPPPTSLSFGGSWFIIFRCLGLAKVLHIIFFLVHRKPVWACSNSLLHFCPILQSTSRNRWEKCSLQALCYGNDKPVIVRDVTVLAPVHQKADEVAQQVPRVVVPALHMTYVSQFSALANLYHLLSYSTSLFERL